MANQHNNKIIFGGETLIDLTEDTATEEDVSNGVKFHLRSGASAVGIARNVAFATCTTAAATKDKVATVTSPGTFSLSIGQIVAVKFTNTNTYSATADSHVTLNVNGTGAKPIYWGNDGAPTGTNTTAFGRANYTNLYIYDGAYWIWIGSSSDNNTTYSAMSVAEGTTGTATSARSISAKNLKEIIDARGYTGNNGTVTSVTMGAGLTGGPITQSGTVKAALKSETESTLEAAAKGSTANREYAVGLDSNGDLSVNIPWTDNNTKNTAGSTNSSAKLFVIGAASQAANPQTYSHDTVYIGTDGCLYSGGQKVFASGDTVPIANGGTGAITADDARTNLEIGVHRVTFSGISSLPQTISDPKVLEAMEITTIEVSNPAAMASAWTVTPADGSVTLSGSMVSGKTTNVIVKLSHAF